MQRNIVLLRQSEQRYQGFLEDQIEIICRFKADNTVIYVNEAFCRLCGKSREELLGHKWNPVVHPDDIQMVIDKVNSVSPSNPIVHIENRIIASDGSVIWGQFVNRGIFNEHGELLEMQAVGRDITERKLIEQALQSESHLFA
jgi:PAS domain S-box-containing protein